MKNSTKILIVFLVLVAFFAAPHVAKAATLYWVGADGGNTSVATNWLTTNPTACGGGNAAAAPSTADIATFDPDCDSGATINAAFTVAGIDIQSGYTSAVTQSAGITVTIGSSNYVQADGTFTDAGNATTNIDINDGSFTLSGGTFSNTGATSNFNIERNFTISGGTFTNTGNTVTFDGAGNDDDSTITCSGTLGGTLDFNKDGSGNPQESDVTIASGCSVALGATPDTVVEGNLANSGTITIASGTWTHRGQEPNSNNNIQNSGTITHSGTGWDINDASLINNSGATITYSGTAITIERNFTQSGTFNLTGITVTLDGVDGQDDSTVTCGSTIQGSITINKITAGADTPPPPATAQSREH